MSDTFSVVIGVVVGVTIVVTVTVIGCTVCYRRKRNISDGVKSVSYRRKKTASEGKDDLSDLRADSKDQVNVRSNVYSSVLLSTIEQTRYHDNGLYCMANVPREKTCMPHEATANDLYDFPKTPKSFHLQHNSVNGRSSDTTSYNNIKGLMGMSTTETTIIPPEVAEAKNEYINTSTLNEIIQFDMTNSVSSLTKVDIVTNGAVYYSKADDSSLLQIVFKEHDGADDVVYDVCRDDINRVTPCDSGEADITETPSLKSTIVYTKLGQQKREFKSPYNVVSPDNVISEPKDFKGQFPNHEASYYNVSRTGFLKQHEKEVSQQSKAS